MKPHLKKLSTPHHQFRPIGNQQARRSSHGGPFLLNRSQRAKLQEMRLFSMAGAGEWSWWLLVEALAIGTGTASLILSLHLFFGPFI